ncbi:MAG: aquaporin family protein [Gammaproteobacteria bacterium]|nr:aquaporin family protein [Gammaproteobacteria bacterium]
MSRPIRLTAEFLGTLFLLAGVVGSGIMGENLADGNVAIALLANTVATGAILAVLIVVIGPLSGAHFNPAVTVVFLMRREIGAWMALGYIAAQISGGICGTWLAHAMFELEVIQTSSTSRSGGAQALAEVVATFGLLATILGCLSAAPRWVGPMVGLYIAAAYWFTASTSFANPAVTIARSLTDTFSGIAPIDAPMFIVAQFVGAILCWIAFHLVARSKTSQ